MLEELNDAPNLTILDENASHILSLMTARQREWLSVENITAIYTLKYNRVIIGFLYIANGKQAVIPAVVGHHERCDGTGYPRGLAGQNIPYMARILTIADCFDAMTAKRPYKQALSVDYAVNELEKNSGTQFNPVLVKQFIELIHEGKISIA